MDKMNKKIIITSGYFNPLHVGHLECMRLAKGLGDHLIVIVNNDEQVKLKGSKFFMNENDRALIVSQICWVDSVLLSKDYKTGSVCNTLEYLGELYKDCDLVFAKGGDRYASEIPEATVCKAFNIKIVDGLGAKIRNSSEILE